MKTWTMFFVLNCAFLLGQTPPGQIAQTAAAPAGQTATVPSEQAPPEVDAALRARVDKFYQAHMTGKYSGAVEVVADEAKDEFIGSDKGTYKACQTVKIAYSDQFEKAQVTETCDSELRWHGGRWPVKVPLETNWKLVNGQWYWYTVKKDTYATPWGVSIIRPQDRAENKRSTTEASGQRTLPDPAVLAKNILQLVKISKTGVKLDPSKASEDQVIVTNGMSGPITLSIDNIGQPGLTLKADKTQLAGGEQSHITVKFDPGDPSIQCEECAKRMSGITAASILVHPTNQVFRVNIIFEKPVAVQK